MDLPWDSSINLKIDYFFEKYTLHDSYYVGLFFDLGQANNIMVVVRWDPMWLPDNISQKTPYVDDWPYLFICIDNVEQISTWGLKDEDIGRAIGEAEFAECENKHILSISDVYGGEVQIVFSGNSYVLALDKDKNTLKI